MNGFLKLCGAMAAVAMLSGCVSTSKISDEDRLAIYRANAGEPVRSFRYFGTLDSWTPLGDEAMAVWTRPSEAYLLEFGSSCPDLDFATAVSVTNQGGLVYARFDKVQVLGQGSIRIPCIIQEIRPLDTRGVKADEAQKREAQAMPAE